MQLYRLSKYKLSERTECNEMFMQEKQKYNFSIILNLFQELTKRPTIITNDENTHHLLYILYATCNMGRNLVHGITVCVIHVDSEPDKRLLGAYMCESTL